MAVRFEISASLDGFVTAANPTLEDPMGPGGQRLHEWAFGEDDVGNRVLAESQARSAASIAGRKTYDRSIAWWGADGPAGEQRTPTFIVSHSEPDEVPEESVYTFCPTPEEALAKARETATEGDVDIFSANIAQQLLRLGEVDEIRIHQVPVLLGAGTHLFEGNEQIQLEPIESVAGLNATHLTYSVVRD